MSLYCAQCGKSLSNKVSVRLGVGPVCRVERKQKSKDDLQLELFNALNAEYSWGITEPDPDSPGTQTPVIWIEDRNAPGCRSVTNDMDNVLRTIDRELAMTGQRVDAYPVIYQDNLKVWDGVVPNRVGDAKSYFNATFFSIHRETREEATLKVWARQRAEPRTPTPVPVAVAA